MVYHEKLSCGSCICHVIEFDYLQGCHRCTDDGSHVADALTVEHITGSVTANTLQVYSSDMYCRFIDGRVWPKEDELEVRLMLDLVRHVTGQQLHHNTQLTLFIPVTDSSSNIGEITLLKA